MGDETLLERILSGDEDPKDLPLPLLQSITNDFSDDRKIGQGGFGAVYKGELQNGIIVAVKRIEVNQITIDDVSFRREFNSLMNTNHQNVVRFLGFCSNTHQTSRKEAGEISLVSVRERLLCFEYIRNGSLDKHITDELRGLEWEPRYAIISGICKGLFYLHEEKKIVHMDLKPPNILLDDHMVPKITDFGLSRSNEMSHTTGQRFGTPGYVAPEYEKDGKTSFKCDIYSLGVIITELVTGRKSVPHKNNVLRRWRHRWNKPPTLLQYRQVTECIEISVRCRQQESGHRPSVLEIVKILGESESMDGHTGQESAYLDDDMLRIEPLELKLNEEMSWSVKLTNKTKASFAFKFERPSQQYTIRPDKGIVTPGCNEYLVQITLQPQQRAPQVTQNADKIIFQSTKVPEGLRDEDITENIFHEEAGKVVDEVDLMIVYEPTKPKENCKSREDTNMPAEEVPEAKRRKIVESARIVRNLEDCTEDLVAKRDDVCQKIENAEREGKTSTYEVKKWLEKVAKIINVVRVISVGCKLKKDVTMEASEKLREVQECLSSCPSTVAIESLPSPVQEMPGSSLSAKDLNLQEALHLIKDEPTVGMIGIWGPGGVGKTHLLRSINNSFGEGMDFNFVLFVTASKECSVEKVQSQIIERLRLPSSGSKSRTIYEYMKKKSFLVLLDDLWDEINLEVVGIPYPLGSVNNLNRKVVLTTRLKKVCGRMKVRKELKVAYLQEHEAWQLFKENIGAETLSSPHIEDLARKLVKELKGLPLALITIGKAMYWKDEYQWETAIQYMKQSCCADDEDPIELGMETNVFKKLKFSYDNLKNKTLRDCFLTCVLWPEDAQIGKVDLAKCWMGLGLVNGPDIESSFRKSYNLIAGLTDACLLDGCEYDDDPGLLRRLDGRVKVHDVIRDMALWISCDCGEKNDKWIVAAPGGRDQKVIMLSNKAECISLTFNRIPIRFNLDPLNLRILCLRNNRLDKSITVEAIKNCSSLTYLDLSRNRFNRIPEELCSLVKLEYLDLSENLFQDIHEQENQSWGIELPCSFGKLINLKFLYLRSLDNYGLRIPAGVISSLKALQVIDLRDNILRKPSLREWIFLELGTLPQLKALGADVYGPVELESLLGEAANLPVRYLNMRGVGADLTGILSTDFAQRTLYDLDIMDRDTQEITVEHDTEQPNTHFGALNYLCLREMSSLREIKWMGATPAFIFPRLTCLELTRCRRLSHLSWAMYLPRLEELCIDKCDGVVQPNTRFGALNYLRLFNMGSLREIMWMGATPAFTFPRLTCLALIGCTRLSHLSWVMYLPRLEQLHIWSCDGMVQAFMRCHGDKLCNGQDKTKTFPCLRFLDLGRNKSLEAIGDKGMEFPSLERLELRGCPKLKRLPFQLDCLPPKLKELWFNDAKDWERLECEEDVKGFLQPLLKFEECEEECEEDLCRH